MLGAIAGDIIGSTHEFSNRIKTVDFPLFPPGSEFTDDTILTVAVADCILHNKDYADTLKAYGRKYPSSYGTRFGEWLHKKDNAPYYSLGNGSAMRVSPVGFAFNSMEEVLREAEKSAAVTHNHPEGIKGAQLVASAILLARQGQSKENIQAFIESNFHYDLRHTIAEIRPNVQYDETCMISVPQAIIAFLDSTDYEDAVRKAVSLGADADTQACITGGIAQAFYREIPKNIIEKTRNLLDPDLLQIVDEFDNIFSLAS